MIGKLVRDKYTDRIGVVLRKRRDTRCGFRYDVFLVGEVRSFLAHFLEVIA